MTAEQWLADLEAKANALMPKGLSYTYFQRAQNAFNVAADHTTVLRLVAMVRWLAGQRDYPCPPEKFRTIDCSETLEELYPCKRCWTEAAYAATEDRHDQD